MTSAVAMVGVGVGRVMVGVVVGVEVPGREVAVWCGVMVAWVLVVWCLWRL